MYTSKSLGQTIDYGDYVYVSSSRQTKELNIKGCLWFTKPHQSLLYHWAYKFYEWCYHSFVTYLV